MRRLLTGSAVPLDSDLGLFVGLEAYEAAGGRVTRDLFSGDDEGFLDDAALVNRLAIEKLEQKTEELRSDWAWAKAVLDPDYGFLSHYRRIEPQPAEYPPEIAAELDRIEARLEELGELPEEELGDDLMMEAARLEERRDEIIETNEAEAVYSEADRKRAGVIVTVGDEGGFLIHQGLVERATAADAARTADSDGEPDGEDADEFPAVPTRRPRRCLGQHSRAMSPEQQIRKECGFSQGHVDDLKSYRLQITRAYLAGDFAVAFDLALYTLCTDLIGHGYRDRPLDLRATETSLRSTLNDLAGTAADRLLTAREAALDNGLARSAAGARFRRALGTAGRSQAAPLRLVCRADAETAVGNRGRRRSGHRGRRAASGDPVCRSVAPRCRQLLGPGQEGARSRDRGSDLRAALGARPRLDSKKAVLAEALENAFDPATSSNCIIIEPALRDVAAAWLPPGFAYAEAAIDAEPAGEIAARNPAATRPTIRSRPRPAKMKRKMKRATTSRPF